MKFSYLMFWLLSVSIIVMAQGKVKSLPVEPGVSYQLAQYRSSVISNIVYHLSLSIPAVKSEPVTGTIGIQFDLRLVDQSLQIDFKQNADHVKSINVTDGMATASPYLY